MQRRVQWQLISLSCFVSISFSPPVFARPASTQEIQQELRRVEASLATERLRFIETHPSIQVLLAQRSNLLQLLAQKSTSVPQPASSRKSAVDQQIYQQLPDFPLENQYVSRESGKMNPRNTLAVRLIRYHTQVKGRAPNYRLDWKLTLADYLGANEIMDDGIYPGADALKQNPFERDRAAIRKLTRKQRDALIQALVNAHTVKP